MTSPEALVRALLEPLLDARRQPATEHFDEALAGALAAGRVTPELARELRFWQRASVHEVTDHVRTVVPAVLPAALTAIAESGLEADQAAAGALSAWGARQEMTPAVEDFAAPGTAEATGDEHASLHDVQASENAVTDQGGTDTSPEQPFENPADTGPSDDGQGPGPAAPETPASTSTRDGAAMSPHVRRRLFVAGLTSTA